MKPTLVTCLSFLLFCGLCSAQSTLQVRVKDCGAPSSSAFYSDFKVFRNGLLIKTVDPTYRSKTVLANLEYGEYRIQYRSIFKKLENVHIVLSEKKEYNVLLCLDYFDHESDPYKPFIDQLKSGEMYSIQVFSQGCFHSYDELINVKRIANNYYVTFNGKAKLLSSKEIITIRRFEIELNYMESRGCTTTDIYVIKYKSEEVHVSDGSCRWNGHYLLKMELNLIED